ncbi:GOLPH3/VPS74 family protein [Glycomyces harbinensis]|uniref:Golgi phosphoprotein 3 (GPP34) n=1 Tax=Glycomyces harbinensis TaxID=58114 RepID=A0A1G6VPD9_9ACTN|nr:GPP34 family phosphoprotein [Glycomyces harbinensis]SDD55520.1 Golgi phosphoprotein 3 (GPP34) [Glycomyces harbinensis]
MVTLVDELVLLAYDDRTGRSRAGYLEFGMAGAVVLELALAERVEVADGRVRVSDRAPVGERVLDEALAALAADKPRKPKSTVERLAKGLKRRVLADMTARGLLREEREKALGLFPYSRHLPRDRGSEAAVRLRLNSAVDLRRAGDVRTAALASLVYALNMERVVFPERKKSETRKALKAISEGSWASEATVAAVKAAQAAVMAAVTAATAASAATYSGS